jgi:hypothetical protein
VAAAVRGLDSGDDDLRRTWPRPGAPGAEGRDDRGTNQPGAVGIKLRGPVSEHDQQALAEGVAAMNTSRSRQAWLNHLIEAQLIIWLADATGQSRADIIQRLAIQLGSVIPPEPPG